MSDLRFIVDWAAWSQSRLSLQPGVPV